MECKCVHGRLQVKRQFVSETAAAREEERLDSWWCEGGSAV